MKSPVKSQFNAIKEMVKLVEKSGAFDKSYYFTQTHERNKNPSNPIKHYLLDGWKLGYEPHPCFSTLFYYKTNKDTHTLNIHPFLHFVMYGYREARYTRQDFFLPDFKASHPQLDEQTTNPFKLYTELYGQAYPGDLASQTKQASSEPNKISSHLSVNAPEAVTPANRQPKGDFLPLANRAHIGRIDVVENGRISGWVVSTTHSQNKIEVEALINGIVYQAKKCSIARPDVNKVYEGNLNCGFEFNIPMDGLSLTNISVSVRVKGTNDIIWPRGKKSPQKKYMTEAAVSSTNQIAPANLTGVAIIIPVYNAPQELIECLESVLSNTNFEGTGHKIILSDDASPDSRVSNILDTFEQHKHITIIRNQKNIGYSHNINHAIQTAANTDVVLLNSDTRVTPNWLELLQRAAYQSNFIGTVSAVSDNAGAFSVPQRNSKNPTPGWYTEEEYGRLVTHTSRLQHLRIPTTSGFCMYIKRALFNDIGLFDSATFPKGYGEENDFCMRAGHRGWEHVLADNVLVFHERSASFLDTKATLMARASDLIPKMYPEYNVAVGQAFVQNSEINQRRFDISYSAIRYPKLPRPRVAYVIGVDSGGTPQTNMDLMSTIQDEYEPYLLLCSTGTIRIFKITGAERVEIELIRLKHPVMPIQHDSDSYKTAIADILMRYSFELVHIRHIGRHGLSLIPIAKSLRIKVIFSLHDFYTVCPNVKLLDAENRFCGGKCTTGGNDCNVELWDSRLTPPLKKNWIFSWQKTFQRILSSCDLLITTSPYARELLKSIYNLDEIQFDVIPHARDFQKFYKLGSCSSLIGIEKLKVFVPGHIVPAKGLQLIKDIKELDTHNQIEFHFAGTSKEDLSKFGVCHGTYERENFQLIVDKIQPHVGGVFSIWPETYSHTLTELWSCGIPVITSSYGATGERLTEHGGGWIVDEMTAQSVFNLLIHLKNTPSEIAEQNNAVQVWQDNYGSDYTISIMTACYKRAYAELLASSPEKTSEIFVIPVGGNGPNTPAPTQHLLPTFQNLFTNFRLSVWPLSTVSMISRIKKPDALVFQYHEELDKLKTRNDLSSLKKHLENVLIVLELSADFVPAELTLTKLEDHPLLFWLIANADKIIVPSTLQTTAEFDQLSLQSMLIDENETGNLPSLLSPPATDFPSESLSYDRKLYERMDREVLSGSTNLVKQHNKMFVSANFTLIDWSALLNRPKIKKMVSIVIPNFNKVGITEKLLRTLTDITNTKILYEVILVDNGSKPQVRSQIERLSEIDSRIRVVCTAVPLMFSVGCNYGASYARGEYLLFLNNDMEVIKDSWLEKLIAPMEEDDEVGIVGAKLLYEDRTVQHAGLVFSEHTNMAYHAYVGADQNAHHVNKRRQIQAVTGACLGLRTADFAKLRGFNPLFVNGCEDVDLCLRMRTTLKRTTIYVPESVLIHLEGKSPGRGKYVLANRMIFNELWGKHIIPDDAQTYKTDGFNISSFVFDHHWLKPIYRSIKVKLSANDNKLTKPESLT